MIDVGAQLGYITGHLARMVGPSGFCASIEPDPKALERLSWMTRENGFSWVRIFLLLRGMLTERFPFFYLPPWVGPRQCPGHTFKT